MNPEQINVVTLAAGELMKGLLADVDGVHVELTEPNSAGARRIEIRHAASGYYERFGLSRYGVTSTEVDFGSKYRGADKVQRKVKTAKNKAEAFIKAHVK